MDGTILIADDDRTIRTVLTQALTRAGCKVHATSSLVTLLRWVQEGKGDLVITDVVMPDGNGLKTLPKITELRPGLPVMVISAQNNIVTAIQAAEAEAYDYLPKPFDLPDLMKRVSRALGMKRRAPVMGGVDRGAVDDLPMVGQTPVMQDLYRLVARVMNADLTVLITGESGTGKSLIARALHDFSDRRDMPFVVAGAVDLVGPDELSRLLARAQGGTLMFEEVGDLDGQSQGMLAHLLDSLGDNAPRIMASSQVDLGGRLGDGGFRSDLFYRLGGVTIQVPPLRDRVDDIALLAEHFLMRAVRDGLSPHRFTPDAMDMIRNFTWPGNVRQLENTVRRLVVTCGEEEISGGDIGAVLNSQPATGAIQGDGGEEKLSACVEKGLRRYFDLHGGVLPPAGLYARILHEIEVPLLEVALEATGGNQAKCADLLGINRNTLRKKVNELDIRVTRRRKLM